MLQKDSEQSYKHPRRVRIIGVLEGRLEAGEGE